MPLVEVVRGPILPEDCQDQNQKRKFVALLWHRIAASLVLALNGPGRAADVASTVLFLASEEARFLTAEIINIDGGAAGKV
jgi:NAD(P)-dependent dehydrogenase (short-subunit alcohol dehydrogenase family)